MVLTWRKRRAFPGTGDQEPRSGRTPWLSAAVEGERDLQEARSQGRTGEGGGFQGMVSRVRGSACLPCVFFFPSPLDSPLSFWRNQPSSLRSNKGSESATTPLLNEFLRPRSSTST
jgi:hypothetical protein